MRRGVTIFFLVLLVCVQTPVGQIFKLPKLVEHFIKHQKQNNVSLANFLKDHYDPNHNDADFPEDQQLPFKDITVYSISNAVVPLPIKTSAIQTVVANKKIVFVNSYTPQQHLASIFHPPRA